LSEIITHSRGIFCTVNLDSFGRERLWKQEQRKLIQVEGYDRLNHILICPDDANATREFASRTPPALIAAQLRPGRTASRGSILREVLNWKFKSAFSSPQLCQVGPGSVLEASVFAVT
jgi:hypothetical protein